MKKKQNKSTGSINFRIQAEDLLKDKLSSSFYSLSEAEKLKIAHELEVYQLESDMQNEELIVAQKAARQAIELYDFDPTGYFTLNKNGEIIGLNISGAGLLNKDKASLKGRMFGFFVTDDTRLIFNQFIQDLYSKKTTENCEITLLNFVNEPIYYYLTGTLDRNEELCLVTAIDITERKRNEERIQYEREIYQDIVNNQPAGIYRIRAYQPENWWKYDWNSSINPPYKMELASDRFCEILNITREEFINKPGIISDLIHPEDLLEFVLKNEEANTKLIPFKWDGRLIIKENVIWVHLESIPRLISTGEVLWTGILYDTSDQKQKEELLIESENKYRNLVDNSPDAISIYSEGKVVFVNNECLRLMGATNVDELLGKPVIEFMHPDYRLFAIERMKNVMLNGKTLPLAEEKFMRLDGSPIDVEVKSMPIVFQNKPAVQLIVRDITYRKQAQEDLLESEKRFHSLFNSSYEAIFLTSTDGTIISANPSSCNMFERTEEELKQLGRNGIIDTTDPRFDAAFEERARTGKFIGELTLLKRNGEKFEGELTSSLFKDKDGEIKASIIIRDITDRKNAEFEITKSREDFKDLFEYAPVGYHEIDSEGRIVRMNQTELILLGYSSEEIIGQYCWIINNNEALSIQSTKEKLQGKQLSTLPYEREFLRKDGTIITVLEQDRILHGADGSITGIRSSVHDITERKLAELNLLLSEEKFRTIFENSVVGKSMNSIEGMMIANKAFGEIVGYSQDELSGMNWTEFTHKEDIEFNKKEIKSILNGEKRSSQWEKRYIHKNGNIVWVDISTFLLRDNEGKPVHFITEIYDITDRKKAELDLRNSEEKFKKAFLTSPDSININRLEDGFYVSVNDGFKRIMGYNEADVLGKTSLDINLWENPEERKKLVHKLKEKSVVENLIVQFRTKTGQTVYGLMSASIIELNGISHILSITRDITALRKTEIALQQSEELYRNLVLRIPDGVYKSTPEGKFIDVNPAMVKMLGFETKEELMNIDIKTQLYFDTADRESLVLNEKFEETGIFQLKKKDGSGIWIEDHGWYNTDNGGNILTHEGVLRDITDRKLAQDALQERELILKRTLIESTGLIDKTYEGINYEKISDTILEISGAKYVSFNIIDENDFGLMCVSVSGIKEIILKVSSVIGFEIINKKWKFDPIREEKTKNKTITKFESFEELTSFTISKKICTLAENIFNIGDTFVVKITKNNKTIGDFTLIYSKGETLRNNELVSLYANQVGLFIDREKIDKELRLNEEKYRYLFANNPQPMWIYDLETLYFIEVNQAAITHYGFSREEFLSKKITEIRPPEDVQALLHDVKTRSDEFNFAGEWRHIKKNGEYIIVEISLVPVISSGRKARHVMVQDITERRRVENSIKESISLLNATIESTADGILVVDMNGKITLLNQKFVDMWNVPKEIIENKNDEPMLYSVLSQVKKQEEFLRKVRFLYDNPKLTSNDQIELIDGRVFDRYSLPHKIGDNIVGRVWSFRDITLSKIAEEALRLSEEKFRSITEQIDDFISVCDKNGVISYASPAAKELFQYEPEEMCGHHFMEYIHKDSITVAMNAFRAGIEDKIKAVDIELKLKRKDGSTFFGELNGSDFISGDQRGALIIISNITSRKHTLELLQESEEKFRSIAEQTNDLISITDMNGVLLYASTASKSIFRYEPMEMCGHLFYDFLDEDSISKAGNAFEENAKKGGRVYNLELKMKRKDGTTFYGELNGSSFNYGDQYGNLVVIRDISERKESQTKLEEKINELMRFQNLTVGREMTMIELKKEINELLTESGKKEKYKIVD